MLDLKTLEGSIITAIVRPFHAQLAQNYKLHRVEQYGIWVESQDYTDSLLASAGRAVAPKTFVAFVPWNEVSVVYGSIPEASLSEKSFGLQT
jgi:hypothetical protein